MNTKLSFNKFALTLAALGTVGTASGMAGASEQDVSSVETDGAIELGDKDDGKKKKDGKKDGSCGSKGGCGAGSCG